MAAATQSMQRFVRQNGELIEYAIRLSAMTSGQVENVDYSVNNQLATVQPVKAEMVIVTAPAALCLVGMICNVAAATAANRTVPVRVYTEAGGDITGCVVDVILSFNAVDSGGFIV